MHRIYSSLAKEFIRHTMKIPDKTAYGILEKYGIELAGYAFARNLKEGETASKKLSFPIVLKIDSPEIIHKSDSGCVQVAFSEAEFSGKFKLLMKNAKKITKKINGVIMQERIDGKEMMIGSKIDEQFGPVMCFGIGGIFVEAMRDVSFRLVPLKRRDAMDMIKDSRAYDVLISRGKSDIEATVDTILAVSKLIEKEKIKELDINPLMVTENGAFAVDVRIIK